jgi:hypothetical protein
VASEPFWRAAGRSTAYGALAGAVFAVLFALVVVVGSAVEDGALTAPPDGVGSDLAFVALGAGIAATVGTVLAFAVAVVVLPLRSVLPVHVSAPTLASTGWFGTMLAATEPWRHPNTVEIALTVLPALCGGVAAYRWGRSTERAGAREDRPHGPRSHP